MSFQRRLTTPSKDIREFLDRHPEVETSVEAKAQLDEFHEGDTFCIVTKIFNNTILHQEYDGDSRKRVFAFAYVEDPEALTWYEKNRQDDNDNEICDCKVGEPEGQDHLLHESVVEVRKAECEKHKDCEEPDPECLACWPVLCGSNCKW
ncbi:hypothetical protein FVEN_g13139 [Fusarium venenatum]|uniref:Uncharacterized protein n=1 Tax=Fusarium venenatum TaxID=56646 RepID=A0A2L2TXD3_9HYPO|nr:uncharacterized protein FVRRES_09393 [Fusarium venenatum]KAG8358313.1 hypothetical protein FVEN_g13139 [Fusarium venenatum]KAH6966074.1 hypothetical protein EDB82DRAFT_514638 [Fusarium venenatum]CEI69316.1 unnamed protein product [Fusarium venenatum]